ncbi:hypothetical protein J5N97_027984 [Dioscorea zingiberensis]|uniref:UDP-glycosyltransferases domain-containing protein n=1 Tax=Dioscorea zingiberensis TaxID=325984 RepID=A0A9D5BYR3_9LILI|nr:hypothetical protein J5N97_027984 [Dioscorea zingiberensis]
MAASKTQDLHILFFPLMAPGHMIPMVNMAKLCSRRGVRTTILTTPANANFIQPTINNLPIEVAIIPFPSAAAGLPAGCENLAAVPSPDLHPNFIQAVAMLSQPFDQVLRELHPNVTITDAFIPSTIDITSKLGIPQLVFHVTGFFPLCLSDILASYNPHETLPAETESFVVPGIPHRIELLKTQVLDFRKAGKEILDLFLKIRETETRSYGVVVNSFYELEPDYVEHYRKMGRRAWHIGPLSLCNEDINMDSSDHSMNEGECLDWLEEKQPGSVLYVCFGSWCTFSAEQLREMALGFEASKHPFIWVLPKVAKTDEEMEWMPEGYVERIQGKGLIMRRWAPQVQILNHRAVGGFLTHCGWNSTLEGVSAGVPMITWPYQGEQFSNERLIVDVLKIGIAVGIKVFVMKLEDMPLIRATEIERAVTRLMSGSEEAEAMRKRAKELGQMAKRAVKEDGSSYSDFTRLINEMSREEEPPFSSAILALSLNSLALLLISSASSPAFINRATAFSMFFLATHQLADVLGPHRELVARPKLWWFSLHGVQRAWSCLTWGEHGLVPSLHRRIEPPLPLRLVSTHRLELPPNLRPLALIPLFPIAGSPTQSSTAMSYTSAVRNAFFYTSCPPVTKALPLVIVAEKNDLTTSIGFPSLLHWSLDPPSPPPSQAPASSNHIPHRHHLPPTIATLANTGIAQLV